MSATPPSRLSFVEEVLRGIANRYSLHVQSIVRKVYGEHNVRMHWLEGDDLQKNIVVSPEESRHAIGVEVNAWMDVKNGSDIERYWVHDRSDHTLPLNDRQTVLDRIEQHIEDAYRRSQQYSTRTDLTEYDRLDLTDEEKALLGYK